MEGATTTTAPKTTTSVGMAASVSPSDALYLVATGSRNSTLSRASVNALLSMSNLVVASSIEVMTPLVEREEVIHPRVAKVGVTHLLVNEEAEIHRLVAVEKVTHLQVANVGATHLLVDEKAAIHLDAEEEVIQAVAARRGFVMAVVVEAGPKEVEAAVEVAAGVVAPLMDEVDSSSSGWQDLVLAIRG